MAEFSYSDDIAPLKGDFFGMRPLSQREGDYLMASQRNTRAEERKEEIAELNYQRAVLAFDRAREESVRQKQEADHLGQVSANLSQIANSDMSSFDKVRSINDTRVSLFADKPMLANSAMTNSLFQSALSSVQARESLDNRYLPQMQALAQLGDAEAARRMANVDGLVTEQEDAIVEIAEAQSRANQQKARSQYGAKRVQTQTADLKADISLIRKFGGETDYMPDSDGGDDDRVSVATPLVLSKDEKEQMRGIADRQLKGEKYAPLLKKYLGVNFDNDASRKNFLINALSEKAIDLFDSLYPVDSDSVTTGPSETNAGKGFFT